MEISGSAAVVTGGGSGIGRAICVALAARGARVVVADVDTDGGNATVAAIAQAAGSAAFQRCDVTRSEEIAGALGTAIDRFGRLDIVCNNAGIGNDALFSGGGERWRKMVAINLSAVIDGTRLAVREMEQRGGGVIVNTASMGGLIPMPGSPVYAATKAAVIHFSRSLAYLAERGIHVKAICPSYTETPLLDTSAGGRMEDLRAEFGGLLAPEDIAAGVVELVEDGSRAGAVMRVTVRGGRDYRWPR